MVVVREESFTRAEKTLAARGGREAIQQIRRRFQQQVADNFTSVVEQATVPDLDAMGWATGVRFGGGQSPQSSWCRGVPAATPYSIASLRPLTSPIR